MEDFCREFLDKLSGAERCCLPAEGSSGLPRCLGMHVDRAADPATGALFAVYWGARTGRLTPDDVAGAARYLHGLSTVDCEGLLVGDEASSADSCVVNNVGLELYAGSVRGRWLMSGGAMVSVEHLAAASSGWKMATGEDPVWSSLDRDVGRYSYQTASVGNFVTYRGGRVEKHPVEVRVCRGDGAREVWVEYEDRTEQLHRAALAPLGVLHGARCSAASLGNVIIMDALYRGYRHDGESLRFNSRSENHDTTRASRHAWEAAVSGSDGKRKHHLVVAVMPALSDEDALAAANDAIVGTSAMYLACRGGCRGRA